MKLCDFNHAVVIQKLLQRGGVLPSARTFGEAERFTWKGEAIGTVQALVLLHKPSISKMWYEVIG